MKQTQQQEFNRKVDLMLSDPRFFGDRNQAIENVKFLMDLEAAN